MVIISITGSFYGSVLSDTEPAFKDLSDRGRINIIGNDGFNSTNGVSSGNGTASDPYIIEGYHIESFDYPAIHIEKTDSFFVIRNCTLIGRDGLNLASVKNGLVRDCNISGLYGVYLENIRVLNNTASSIYYPIRLFGDRIEVKYNTCKGGVCGIFVSGEDGIIQGNMCSKNGVGISLSMEGNILVQYNICEDNEGNGIGWYPYFEGLTYLVELKSNTCRFNGGAGIDVSDEDILDLRMSDNVCSWNGLSGIVCGASQVEARSNGITNNSECGLVVEGVDDFGVIMDNRISSSGITGILIDSSVEITVTDNEVRENDKGMEIQNSTVTMRRNRIERNRIGISAIGESDGRVYNNYFDNVQNNLVRSTSRIEWNISRINDMNINGGPYIGGNYWSDYSGADVDGDGLGDTELPYGPGDWRPLTDINMVEIQDNTAGIPMTGSPFLLTIKMVNSPRPFQVFFDLEAQFLLGSKRIDLVIMRGSMIVYEDYLNLTVPIHEATDRMEYHLSVRDLFDNIYRINGSVPVEDTIPPRTGFVNIVGMEAGNTSKLTFGIEENIGLSELYLEYSFDDDPGLVRREVDYSADIWEGKDCWTFEVDVNRNCTTSDLALFMEDVNGLKNRYYLNGTPVKDAIRPVIVDMNERTLREMRTENLEFLISDNIKMEYSVVKVAFPGLQRTFQESLDCLSDHHKIAIDIPQGARTIEYTVDAYDEAGNHASLHKLRSIYPNSVLAVRDLSQGDPRTGRGYVLDFDITGLVANVTHYIYHGFDGDPVHISKANLTRIDIAVPADAYLMKYGIMAIDGFGTIYQWDLFREVIDIISPQVSLSFDDPITGGLMDITAVVTDNRLLNDTSLRYSFGDGEWTDAYSRGSGHFLIDIPVWSLDLEMTVSAWDMSGNYANISINATVLDMIPPEIVHCSEEVEYEGHEAILIVKVRARDNRELAGMTIHYWTPNSMDHSVVMNPHQGLGDCQLRFDRDLGSVVYWVTVNDTAGNIASTSEKSIPFDPDQREPLPWFWITTFLLMAILMISGTLVFIMAKRRGSSPGSATTPNE